MLLQAIDELAERYRGSEAKLACRPLWLRTFLGRSEMLEAGEKQKVGERLDTFEQLLEQSSYIQKQRALGEAKGEKKGEKRGALEMLQRTLIKMVRKRFPSLQELAQQRVIQSNDREKLDTTIDLLLESPDEETVRTLLNAL